MSSSAAKSDRSLRRLYAEIPVPKTPLPIIVASSPCRTSAMIAKERRRLRASNKPKLQGWKCGPFERPRETWSSRARQGPQVLEEPSGGRSIVDLPQKVRLAAGGRQRPRTGAWLRLAEWLFARRRRTPARRRAEI